MSDTPSNTLRDLLRSYVTAPTWAASREIVTQHQEVLLTPAADAEFAAWIAEEEAANKPDLSLAWYREVLHHCQTEGINATFDHLPEPRPIDKAFLALLDTHEPKTFLQLIQDFPEIISESASKMLLALLIAMQTNQEAAESFKRHLTLLEMAKAALYPIPEDLVALLMVWIEADTWRQSKTILTENAQRLLTQEVIRALNRELLEAIGKDEKKAEVLLFHRELLEKVRAESIDAAYTELLKPSSLEQALQRLPEEILGAVEAMLAAKSPTELTEQIEKYPILLSSEGMSHIEKLLEELKETEQEEIVRIIQARYDILKRLFDSQRSSFDSMLHLLMQANTPSELRRAISHYPAILDDETLSKVAELITEQEQQGNKVFSQVLRLRYNELKRLQRQANPTTSSTLSRLFDEDRPEQVQIYAESGGIAINQMFGDIYQVENYTSPAKQWQPPRHQSIRKRFIGRQEELQTLREYLTEGENVAITGHKLATMLHGMGGIGKTYLALKLTIELEEYFPGGVIRIDFGPQVTDEEGAQSQLGRLASYAFGGILPIGQLHPEQVAAWLEEMAPGRLLVIFDDVWHQVPLRFLSQALPPSAVCIVTTRYANVAQTLGGKMITLDRLTPQDGLALLEDRLKCQGDSTYRADLEELVAMLEGHALALDIAAGLIKRPARISVVLKHLQRGSGREIVSDLKLPPSEERDENLEKSLSLSYEWMTSKQRQRFRALGVFAAETPITADSAAAIWGMDDQGEVQNALFELADLALLSESEESSGTTYRQHGLLRAYALAWLDKEKEFSGTSWAHAQYYNVMIERVGQTLPHDYTLLDQHTQNILAALHWSINNEPALFAEMLAETSYYLYIRGYMTLLETYLPKAVTIADAMGDKLQQAFFLGELGDLNKLLGYIGQVKTHYEAALSLYHNIGYQEDEAKILRLLGEFEFQQGNIDQARTYYESALLLYQSSNTTQGVANLLSVWGVLETQLGNIDQARAHYEAALSLYRSIQDRSGEAELLKSLGDLERMQNNYDQAHIHYETALSFYQAEGNLPYEAHMLYRLGILEIGLNNTQARIRFDKALSIYRDLRNHLGEANVLRLLGNLEDRMDNTQQARIRYEAALPLFDAVGDRLGEASTHRGLGMLEEKLNNFDEARRHYETALSLYRGEHALSEEAISLFFLGNLEVQQKNANQAQIYFEAALPLFQAMRDQHNEAEVLRLLGNLENQQGKLDQARTHLSAALTLSQGKDDRLTEAKILWQLGEVERRLGNLDQARIHLNAALPLSQAEGNPQAHILWLLGEIENQLNNFDQARIHLNAALSLSQAEGDRLIEAEAHSGLGEIEKKQGNFDQAQAHYEAALPLYRVEDYRQLEAFALKDLAKVLMVKEHWTQAKSYYEQALQLFIDEQELFEQASTLVDLGHVLFELGEHKQGMEDIRQAVVLARSIQNQELALRAVQELIRLHARLIYSEANSKSSLSQQGELFEAFASVQSNQAMLQLARQKPQLLTNEWFILVEALIVFQTDEHAKQNLEARLQLLKLIRHMQKEGVQEEEVLILIDFANANWATRRQLLFDHADVLLSESVDQHLDLFLKSRGDTNGVEWLRVLLHRCRTWGIDQVEYSLRMHLGNVIDIPPEHEAVVIQIVTFLMHQNEDQAALPQAVETMQTLLSHLPSEIPSPFRAALLHDLADSMWALPTDHPARKLDQIEAYYREALLVYQAASRLLSVASLQHSLGNVLNEQGRYDEALELLQAAIQGWRGSEYHKSDTAWALSAYASVLDHAGQIEEALAAYNEAIMLLPDTPPLLRNRAGTMIHARRLDEAEADLARAVELDGHENSPYLWSHRAQLAIARGDVFLADQMLDEVIKRASSFDVMFARAQTAWLQGNINIACSELRRALDKANQGERNAMHREMEHLLNEHVGLAGRDTIWELLGEFTVG